MGLYWLLNFWLTEISAFMELARFEIFVFISVVFIQHLQGFGFSVFMTTSTWIVHFSFRSVSVSLTVFGFSGSKKTTPCTIWTEKPTSVTDKNIYKKTDTIIQPSCKNLSLQSSLIDNDAHFKITRPRYLVNCFKASVGYSLRILCWYCLAFYSSSLPSALATHPLSRERRRANIFFRWPM